MFVYYIPNVHSTLMPVVRHNYSSSSEGQTELYALQNRRYVAKHDISLSYLAGHL